MRLHSHHLPRAIAALCAAAPLWSATFALAQDPPTALELGAGALWQQAFGLTRVEGALHAAGPHYTASLDAQRFEFAPILGAEAERAALRFRLASIRRGDEVIFEAGASAPEPVQDGLLARIARSASIEERFETRRDGIEHSFRFAEPLPGEGDLVVALRVESDLDPVVRDGALRFERAGSGGVAIGAATGIAADGKRETGFVRFENGMLEYGLPAAFVESARYPLVLDPLIGSSFQVLPSTSNAIGRSDVAFDRTNNTYLIVWLRNTAAGSTQIQGQRVSTTGTLIGGLITIQPAVANELHDDPAVANLNSVNRFVVVYERTPPAADVEIRARTVNASDGAVSATSALLSSGGGLGHLNPDVGGQSGASGANALAVWETTTETIRGRLLTVSSAAGAPAPSVVGSEFTIGSQPGFDEHLPAVTKHSGTQGRFLVTWERVNPLPATFIGTRVVDAATGALLTPMTTITSGLAPNELDPDAATADGNSFLVVYESDAIPGIACRAATFDSATGTLALAPELELARAVPPPIPFNSTLAYLDPSIDFAPGRYLIAFRTSAHTPSQVSQPASGSTSIRLLEVDPACGADPTAEIADTASTTEPFTGLSGGAVAAPSVCARFSGDGTTINDEGLLVWAIRSFSSSGFPPATSTTTRLRALLVEALGTGGSTAQLGPACGNAGTATISGPPVIGSPTFAHRLVGAPPFTSGALFNLNVPQALASCGACQLLPFGITIAMPVASGASTLPSPIPCDPTFVNVTLAVQWMVFPTGTAGCPQLPNLGFTNTLAITIGDA